MPVRLLHRSTFTRIRSAAGSYALDGPGAGVFTPGADTSTTISGTLVPASAREIDRLPEGVRQRARWRLFTDPDTLLTGSVAGSTEPDRVVVEGIECVVVSVERYPFGAKPHESAILALPEMTT